MCHDGQNSSGKIARLRNLNKFATALKMQGKSLQETHAPMSICFGCGPSNKEGLNIRSFETSKKDALIATWTPKAHHEAFPGVLNGGIIGALLDCHSNWTAAWALMKRDKLDHPPCTVTAEFSVKLLRPTDSKTPVELHAMPVQLEGDRAVIEAKMISKGKVSATCRGTFVSVKEGHPAFYRW